MNILSGAKVAVTGGAGFIGSHLVDRLLADGNEVVVIDDLSAGRRENLAHHGGSRRLQLIVGSILDADLLDSALRGVKYVFHLATRNVRLSLRQPTIVHEVNTTGTFNVLKASAAQRVQRLLYCSSSEVYGTAVAVPMVEDYLFRPETIYGASKLTGEYYTQVFHKSGWLQTVTARPHNAYGPRAHYTFDAGEVIPRFIIRALAGFPPVIFGSGTQTRDFTFVEETAQCLIGLMASPAAAGQTYNICRGEEVTIRHIAELVTGLVGLDKAPEFLPPRPNDVLRLYGDPTRLRTALGSAPSISIRDGLVRTVAWYKSNVPITDSVLASMKPENWADVAPEGWIRTGQAP